MVDGSTFSVIGQQNARNEYKEGISPVDLSVLW
jgi:hypothetical protein